VRRILLWVNLLAVLLVVGHTAVAVCQEIPAAAPTTPPCVPPFSILKPDTPKKAFNFLMAGNARYTSGKGLLPNRCPWGAGQTPFAEILSCSDARVPPEILFDTGNNQLFLVRVAGNTVGNPHVDPPQFPPLDMQNSLMFHDQLLLRRSGPDRKGSDGKRQAKAAAGLDICRVAQGGEGGTVAAVSVEFERRLEQPKGADGDYAEVVRVVRNLVHPAAYVADHHGRRVTRKNLQRQFDVVPLCRDWLAERNNKALLEHLKAKGIS
jgi:Carbonic anhydrase